MDTEIDYEFELVLEIISDAKRLINRLENNEKLFQNEITYILNMYDSSKSNGKLEILSKSYMDKVQKKALDLQQKMSNETRLQEFEYFFLNEFKKKYPNFFE